MIHTITRHKGPRGAAFMLTPATSRKSEPKIPPPGAVLMDYDGLAVIGFPVAGVWGPVGRYWHFNPRLGRWVARQPGEFCRFTKHWFWMRQFGHLLP
jgi:hypothetical protein